MVYSPSAAVYYKRGEKEQICKFLSQLKRSF